MSYDVGLEINTGGEYPASVGGDHNYTYNVAKMFGAAFACDKGLCVIHNLTGAEGRLWLVGAIDYMEAHMDKMRDMNPPNGWGDAEGALEFLRKILADCTDHPLASIRIT